MKKLLFTLCIAFLLVSCDIEDQKPGIATIKNNSVNFDVVYVFGYPPTETKAITKNSINNFERPLYAYVKSYEPSKRVSLKTEYPYKNDATYTFSEKESYSVKVINKTGETVVLSADGWMDDIDLTAVPDEQSKSDWLIYTDKPNFTAAPANGFPADVIYNFENDVFRVTIRWSN